ncbi:IclR family transcriptional regulator [Haloarcula sp. S1CR25-12]|uniref:IclR family transcriptional regulator n=1 Tax=Haloarcula saliterrae TaxID=2950534 RepID=A0ABU2FFR3_9EURY|nr:IclR family transcriptional regulator [Haloarcula sp. S1CR25-12]MDS0261104.1 IclR family transcriptional regulator [Haloarcula sp. S1CR25-12]
MTEPNTPRTLKTVTTATEVIDALATLDSAGVTALADHLGLSKSTTYTHLQTLESAGLVTKHGTDYQLSYKFLQLGEYVKHRSLLYQVGKPEVDRLADDIGQYCHLVSEENGRGVNLYKIRGETAVGDEYQAAKLQHRDRLHMTAAGKAILSALERERVEEIIETHGLPRWTEHTITDPDELFETLSEIRERGYAYNDEEEIEGLRAVGAPICDREGLVLGALSVSGPTSFLKGGTFRQAIPERIVSAANVIEVNINMSKQSDKLAGDQ